MLIFAEKNTFFNVVAKFVSDSCITSNLQVDDIGPRYAEVRPCCCYECRKRSDVGMILGSGFIGRTTGGNGMQGMWVGDSVQYHAWYVSRLSRRNHMCGMQGMTHCNGTQSMWTG